ncbi:toll/interleukin-1 receptor domain-containing protein [Barnesiella sp. An22]|uniref:toll/interleukin-1 receptor domain-containing protein n=1 Tax=Barnesiella sp. An22 TaxID=1965590 RepID=UPI000B3AA3E6|nr:toll/interleukin-1 receptor domain-containing protein [Barnesiella sp. An22]OUO97471.1 hypothetical protein B5F38_10250 [Barnesiella sp. An22]HJB72979.1 toll/interleukin-1 receptor domain-containing protein [Candidatus Barnesiella merdigallinarum]
MMELQYKYLAFITYSRTDIKWAKWLQKRLETYKLPNYIKRGNPGATLTPIFADVNELSSGLLSDTLQKSLEKSKFLIVICSPNSAKSHWVNCEVQKFIDLGRSNHIIPFIVDYGADKEYLPEALRYNEILGIDAKMEGREAAFIRVLARLLDIDFNVLWKRQRLSSPFKIISSPFIYLGNLIRKILETPLEIDALDRYVPQRDNTDIFISYRRIDGRDVARTIEQALQKDHYPNVFFDYTSIQDGKFNLKIIDAIFSCKDFILVLSPQSMKKCHKKGDWVAREIRTALKYKSHIIPVVIENGEGNTVWRWPKNFPEDLSEIKDLEQLPFQMGTYFRAAMERLTNRLRTLKYEAPQERTDENLVLDSANLKIKYTRACNVYIDEELCMSIEENKFTKILLKKGEYLLKITTLDDKKILLEEKLDLSKDRLYTDFN